MRTRWLAAWAVLVAAGHAAAQPRAASAIETPVGPPAELPLIPVPGPAAPQPPFAPRGPVGEYDHGYLYIPERAPEPGPPDAPCGPPGRFWFSAALALADTPTAHTPGLRMNPGTRAGLILGGGLWLDPAHVAGVDAGYFHLGSGEVEGFGTAYTARFDTADVNYRHRLICGDIFRLDGLAGYRYGRVEENIHVFGRREVTTENQFHGGQIGLSGEVGIGPWFVGGGGSVAFGVVYADTSIVTLRRVIVAEESRYAVMPAASARVGRAVGEHGRAFVGYQFVGMSDVTRAPDPGHRCDFWAQGVTLGLELRY